jgi:hypothetical protein
VLAQVCATLLTSVVAGVACLQWIVHDPEGKSFPVVADGADYAAMIERVGGPAAAAQWKRLEQAMKPLQKGAALFPAAAIRWVFRV